MAGEESFQGKGSCHLWQRGCLQAGLRSALGRWGGVSGVSTCSYSAFRVLERSSSSWGYRALMRDRSQGQYLGWGAVQWGGSFEVEKRQHLYADG